MQLAAIPDWANGFTGIAPAVNAAAPTAQPSSNLFPTHAEVVAAYNNSIAQTPTPVATNTGIASLAPNVANTQIASGTRPPSWMDTYNNWFTNEYSPWAISAGGRPDELVAWNMNGDAARQKLALDAQYQASLDAYNASHGTNYQADQRYLGINSQPNTYFGGAGAASLPPLSEEQMAENNPLYFQDYVTQTLADQSLTDWEKTSRILDKQKQVGINPTQMTDMFGATDQPYLSTYKSGITDYINQALATDPTKTTFDEVAQIHQAANKYGLTAEDIAKYTGMDKEEANSYFNMYDQGLGNIVANLVQSGLGSPDTTRSFLTLQNKYGTTDAELAKAAGTSESAVKSSLEPVRDVSSKLYEMMTSDKYSAADIQKFIDDSRKNARAQEVYGTTFDQLEQNKALLDLRDAVNGTRTSNSTDSLAQSYDKFVTQAKADPVLAAKYAPQIAAIEQAKSIIGMHARDHDMGGKYSDYAMEMFLGLDKKTANQAPQQLRFAEPEGVVRHDDEGTASWIEYKPAKVTNAKVETLTSEEGAPIGYRKKLKSDVFGNDERNAVYANYDLQGNLVNYTSGADMNIAEHNYYVAKWNPDGTPAPEFRRSGGSGFSGLVQGIAGMGPVGMLALAAATGGLGGLAAEALGSSMLASAAGSGLASGALTSAMGGDFGKGFLSGGLGNLAGNYVGANLPASMTGNTMADSYLTKALPNLAAAEASALVNNRSLGDTGIASLLNTGINMGVNEGTNALLGKTGMDKLGAAQPYATGVVSNALTSAIRGKPYSLQKALTNTMLQQAMSGIKTAAKPKG